MIRLATTADAERLLSLNNQFNGDGSASLAHIRDSLSNNFQEIVVVAEEDGALMGFACAQVKQSFCYDEPYAEISEVFVAGTCRRRKIASRMLEFMEDYCARRFQIHSLELPTESGNLAAQALYRAAGYASNGEILMRKRR